MKKYVRRHVAVSIALAALICGLPGAARTRAGQGSQRGTRMMAVVAAQVRADGFTQRGLDTASRWGKRTETSRGATDENLLCSRCLGRSGGD